MSGDAGGVGLQRANQALKHAKDAKAAADAAGANFTRTGIKAGNGQFTAPLPEGVREIFSPFFDGDDNLVGGFVETLEWLAHGLRLLKFGKLQMGDHTIASTDNSDFPFRVLDKDGNPVLLMDRALRWLLNHLKVFGDAEVAGSLRVGGVFSPAGGIGSGDAQLVDRETNWPWAAYDENGNPFIGIREDDVHLMHVGPSVRLRLWHDDALNRARTAATMNTPHNLTIAVLDCIRALFMIDGQSLGTAYEAWPAITKTSRNAIAWMIGQSVRAANANTGGGWTPQGGASTLNPLIGTVEPITGTARVPMSDADVAAIDPANSANYEGENAIVAVVNGVARRWLTLPGAPARKLIGASTGYGGHPIELLQQGNNQYLRVTQLLDLHKSLAVAAGETWNVPSVTWWQGEANYKTDGSTTITSKADYKAQLKIWRDNLIAQLASRGQTVPPAMFIHVTCGSFVNDVLQASISMAQVEFALETPGVFIIGPSYGVTNKGNGHRDSNGERWAGVMNVKVQRRIFFDQLGHEPFYPYKIEALGRWIYIHMGGAVGSVQFQPAYIGSVATMYPDAGFRAQDASGFATIEAVEVIAPTIVGIRCDRALDIASGLLWYADRTVHFGTGNLFDSDPARSEELYEYLAGTGMYSAANIAALVNQPYPLFNSCSPFVLPLSYSR